MPLDIAKLPEKGPKMLINMGPDLYLDEDGEITEDVGKGVSLLCAKGSPLDEGTALRHGATARLTPDSEVEFTNPVTNQPIVQVDGRAYAKNLYDPPNREWGGPGPKSPTETEIGAKHISGPGETKMMIPPTPSPAAVPAPAVVPEAVVPAPPAPLAKPAPPAAKPAGNAAKP